MDLDDVQDTVSEIRAGLSSQTEIDQEAVMRLAARYRQLVDQTNSRLHECEQLLQRGLRSEALQICSSENLLDILSVLDFPESENWIEYLSQLGERTPHLLVELGAELAEAYEAEAPLHALMRNHRLLALARSPLPTRISVMRRIAEVDRSNPIWPEDIRTFERVRLEQLGSHIAKAYSSEDTDQLRELVSELSDPAWLEPPPRALLQHAENALRTLQATEVRSALEALLQELKLAYELHDVERGQDIRARWHAQVSAANNRVEAELTHAAAPVLAWLDAFDRQEQSEGRLSELLLDLERALDEGAPQLELDRISYAILKRDHNIPLLLQRRLDERMAQLKWQERRRTMLVLLALILAAFGTFAVVLYALGGIS